MGFAIAAAVVSAIGVIQQGQASKKAANFQASVQLQQAAREREIAAANEQDFRRGQSRLMAQRRATLGGSGVQIGTGSPLIGSEDFTSETELGALRIRAGGETQATRLEQQASLTRFEGKQAQTASFFRAGSSLLNGFSKAFPGSTGSARGID